MSFLYPLGLLGLIGVPVLIIIYIIKNKYTEQTIASTYLWTLSNKFLKRKNPISKLTGIISLILQILTIVCLSLAIAHPSVIIPNAAYEYCFILDASGSMNMRKDGVTRFDRAKTKIADMIEASVNGSVFTLVYVGNGTNVLYEQIADKEQALSVLSEAEVAYDTADFTDAIGTAQGYYDKNKALQAYLVTDSKYQKAKNINVINVSESESNYAISDVTYAKAGGVMTVNGNLVSYGKDATLTVNVYTDGDSANSRGTQSVEVKKDEATPFQVECSVGSFSSLRVAVAEADAMAQDSEYIVYNATSESSYDTLIVSDTPFLIQKALEALVNARIDVVSPEAYSDTTSGYGLYIFDSYSPTKFPTDGSIWLIDPRDLSNSQEAGFTVQGVQELESSDKLTLSTSSSSTVQKLKADLIESEAIYVKNYVRCAPFTNVTTLYSYQSNPVIFASTNAYGNRQTVFAFNFHDSNITMLYNYLPLFRNLIAYSFPDIVDKTDYICGELADINVVANCESIRVVAPSGSVSYLDTNNATARLTLEEVGTYTVTLTVGQQERTVYVYSAMTEAERVPVVVVEEEIRLQGMPTKSGFDGTYDLMTVLFIALAVLFIADWGVYCYEKRQLR